jgi:polygalacturonase
MKEFYFTDFGAVGDGVYDNSEAFRQAFGAIQEGGVLHLGQGCYMTGPLSLTASNAIIVLEQGTVIRFFDEETRYRPFYSRWEGVNCYCMHPCFLIHKAEGLIIKGSGTIDGNGCGWWTSAKKKRSIQKGPVTKIEHELASLNPGYEKQSGGGGGRISQFLRPPLLQVLESNNVKIEGITLQNSPFWTLHPLYSTNVICKGLKIINPPDAPNTDGIDVDSCRFVTIEDCLVDVGDDGIALKSGSGPDGIKTDRITSDVLIQGCTVKNAHGGAVIGSETAAGIQQVRVHDCFFDGTDRGIRIKTRRGRGGNISKLYFSHIKTRDNLCGLTVNMYYRCGSLDPEDFSLDKKSLSATTPSIEDVVIDSCRFENSTSSAAFLVGLPESPIRNLKIRDTFFSVAVHGRTAIQESEMYAGLETVIDRGIRLRNIEIEMHKVSVEGVQKPLVAEDAVLLVSS